MDRRAIFFAASAIVCAVLIAPTDSELRWVPISMSIAYVVLALLSLLDAYSRHQPPPS
jgi:hypothetical protein